MATPFYQTALKRELAKRIERNPRYSLRAFAGALDTDAGTLSQVMSGKRAPSFKLSQQLVSNLGLSPEDKIQFIGSIAEHQKSRGLRRLSPAFRKYEGNEASSTTVTKELSVELFKIISDWYHYAILELACTKNFKSNPAWIASQLNITETEAALAMDRLIELELLERDENGKLKKTDAMLSTGPMEFTTAAHRKRQRQILEKSIDSLDNHPLDSRNHAAVTMGIDPERLPEAKRRIDKFIEEMCGFLEGGSRKQVYEMQISLFPLSKGDKS
jgi:uncharacterized protein (TIGR02147 family)